MACGFITTKISVIQFIVFGSSFYYDLCLLWQAHGFNEKETPSPGKFLNVLELTNCSYVMPKEGVASVSFPGSPNNLLNWTN